MSGELFFLNIFAPLSNIKLPTTISFDAATKLFPDSAHTFSLLEKILVA